MIAAYSQIEAIQELRYNLTSLKPQTLSRNVHTELTRKIGNRHLRRSLRQEKGWRLCSHNSTIKSLLSETMPKAHAVCLRESSANQCVDRFAICELYPLKTYWQNQIRAILVIRIFSYYSSRFRASPLLCQRKAFHPAMNRLYFAKKQPFVFFTNCSV